MTAVRIPIQRPEIRHDRRAERGQVEVADELDQVGLLLHHDGLAPVLREQRAPFVAPPEGVPQGGMRRARRLRCRGRVPVRIKRRA